jgi:hypothetical protein
MSRVSHTCTIVKMEEITQKNYITDHSSLNRYTYHTENQKCGLFLRYKESGHVFISTGKIFLNTHKFGKVTCIF